MKAYNILALATVPALCCSLTSCSRDAEDYIEDTADIFNEAAELLEEATPSNADEIADDINDLVDDLKELQKEAKEDEEELKKEIEGMTSEEKAELMKPALEAGMKLGFAIEKAQKSGAMDNSKLQKAVMSLMSVKPM